MIHTMLEGARVAPSSSTRVSEAKTRPGPNHLDTFMLGVSRRAWAGVSAGVLKRL